MELIFQGNFVVRDALIQQRRNLLKRTLVCLVVDTDNIDAKNLRKIVNYFLV